MKNFPRDGHHTVVIGTEQIVKKTKIKWPCLGTIQCFMVSQINHLYMELTPLILLNNLIFTL